MLIFKLLHHDGDSRTVTEATRYETGMRARGCLCLTLYPLSAGGEGVEYWLSAEADPSHPRRAYAACYVENAEGRTIDHIRPRPAAPDPALASPWADEGEHIVSGVKGLPTCQTVLREVAEARPDAPIIKGGSWEYRIDDAYGHEIKNNLADLSVALRWWIHPTGEHE